MYRHHIFFIHSFNNGHLCVCVHARVCALSRAPVSVTPWTVACEAPPWDFPGRNTRLGCHFLLRGLFPTQGLNLLHWQTDSLPLRRCFRILAIVNNAAIMVAQLVKNTPAIQDTPGSIPGLGMVTHFRILAWRAPMDRGAWQARVHGVTKNRTWLSR